MYPRFWAEFLAVWSKYCGGLREFPDKSSNFGILYGRVYGPLGRSGSECWVKHSQMRNSANNSNSHLLIHQIMLSHSDLKLLWSVLIFHRIDRVIRLHFLRGIFFLASYVLNKLWTREIKKIEVEVGEARRTWKKTFKDARNEGTNKRWRDRVEKKNSKVGKRCKSLFLVTRSNFSQHFQSYCSRLSVVFLKGQIW